jgi:hypothetical protein
MRILTACLAIGLLLLDVTSAVAQSTNQSPPAPSAPAGARGGSASPVGINSNTNTLTTGSNTNRNLNTNTQFLSGNNTGVNNGSLEVYSGADPYQGIILEGSVDLPQLPGFVPPTNNFSQPYRPDTFVNLPAFLPAEMTLAEAKECRDSKVSWYGGSREKSNSIKLLYSAKQESPAEAMTMASYVGTAMAQTSDGPFLAALCEAAYRAMRKGATVGIVDYSVRPKNTMSGIGYGASGGATGLPAAGTHPYAVAGALGFGTGWSNQRVEGEVLLQLTALREGSRQPAAEPAPPSPAVRPTVPGRVGTDPTPTAPESTDSDAPGNGNDAIFTSPMLVRGSDQQLADERTSDTAPTPHDPAAASDDESRPARSGEGSETQGGKEVVQEGSETPTVHSEAPAPPVAREPTATGPLPAVMYHPPKKLAAIRSGDSKDRVFSIFGTEFFKRGGKMVKLDGMRLRVSGQSRRNTRIEVSEVTVAEPDGIEALYWFFFENGRLLAWGRPHQWASAAARYRVDLAYPSDVSVAESPNAVVRPSR